MLVGVRKKIEVKKRHGREGEGMMVRKVRLGRDWWRMMGVYVNKDMKKKLEDLEEWMEVREEGVRVVIGGDFNAWTGRGGGEVREEKEWRHDLGGDLGMRR